MVSMGVLPLVPEIRIMLRMQHIGKRFNNHLGILWGVCFIPFAVPGLTETITSHEAEIGLIRRVTLTATKTVPPS